MWSTAIVTAIAMAAVTGTVVLILSALTRNSVDSALDDRIALVTSAVETGPDGSIRPLRIPDDSVDESTWIFDTNGKQLQGPDAGRRVQAAAESLSRVTRRTNTERRERVYLAEPIAASGSGAPNAVVVVSESLEPYESTRTQVVALFGVLGLVVTAGSTAIAAWTVRRALAPVESMAARAEEWSEHDLESRFTADARGSDEIGALGHTLNHLLDRVTGALRNEQRLTAELAHELRTPLTAIRGEAELGLITTDDESAKRRLTEVVDLVERMNSTITTLLAVARGDAERGTSSRPEAIIASVLADHTADDLARCRVHVTEDVDVAAPLTLAARALAPLVDNALSHATSVVTITTTADDRTVEIAVSDDGPGLQDADTEAIFDAGRRSSTSLGAGLGLSLSRRVARTLGGDATLTSGRSPTTFTITLPRP
ncbi:sensor histidine kinase [Aeromicrobium endophyticum]|uniref:sensor histidine kinase n=1 Tax=Aeromicrobium endophyticum TaxID=2292704 RepID=UPI0018F7808E|nr:HAMP domain-containing sensor histidine kinase [Aeromicrobium endophyticum]